MNMNHTNYLILSIKDRSVCENKQDYHYRALVFEKMEILVFDSGTINFEFIFIRHPCS